MSDTFKRYVQVGRVVLLNDGPQKGSLAVIVEIIDHNRALIEGPTTGVPRQAFAYRRMSLTPLLVKGLPRGVRQKTLKASIDKAGVVDAWHKSSWAQKIKARDTRRALGDFERFQVRKLKQERSKLVHKQLKQSA